jgi:predicted GNAT superfamily acetyltransferase
MAQWHILCMLIVCDTKLYLRNTNVRWNLNRLARRRNSEAVNNAYEFVKTANRRKFVLLFDQPDTNDYDSSNFLFQDRTSVL